MIRAPADLGDPPGPFADPRLEGHIAAFRTEKHHLDLPRFGHLKVPVASAEPDAAWFLPSVRRAGEVVPPLPCLVDIPHHEHRAQAVGQSINGSFQKFPNLLLSGRELRILRRSNHWRRFERIRTVL
jgi:hypothetical protein